MPIPDKIAAAQKISEFLNAIIAQGDFHLRYKITVDPPATSDREWEHPEILVELSGADSPLVLENGGELLRAFEHVSLEMLRLAPDDSGSSVHYEGDVQVGGTIASVGQRLLDTTSKMIIKKFFEKLAEATVE